MSHAFALRSSLVCTGILTATDAPTTGPTQDGTLLLRTEEQVPAYDYAARDPEGQLVRGCISAESADQARKLLRRRELFVVEMRIARPDSLWNRLARLFGRKPTGPSTP